MLTITKQSDYGILFIENLIGKKDFVPLSELVEKTKLPKRFLARIAATLVKNKIVLSREGKVGGYKLIKNLKKFSLHDFLKIFEKDVAVTKCSCDHYNCRYEHICKHQHFFKDSLNKAVISELKKITLDKLITN